MNDAVEIAGDPDRAGPFIFSCEHASNRLPFDLRATDAERALLADHWGWDIGAANVARAMAAGLGCQAVFANFSRLVVDPNREPKDDTYIVREIDGHALSFNADIEASEHMRRTRELFEPYHAAVDEVMARRIALGPPVHLVTVHSFTPVYLGSPRPMEIGVLFDDYDRDAWEVEQALAAQGFESALNEPYSGQGPGALIYSARRHGRAHGIKYLELEIRQDLIDTARSAREVASRIAGALDAFRPPNRRT